MRAAKYVIATGEIRGIREYDTSRPMPLPLPMPALPEGIAYLGLGNDDVCDPDLHRVVDGAIVPKLAISADTLGRWRRNRKQEAQAFRDDVAAHGCATPLGRVQTPPASLVDINGLVTMATLAQAAGRPFVQTFRMADNSMVDHDAAQMIALGVAVGEYVAVCSAAYFAIADAINASDDPATVDIFAGYPAPGDAA